MFGRLPARKPEAEAVAAVREEMHFAGHVPRPERGMEQQRVGDRDGRVVFRMEQEAGRRVRRRVEVRRMGALLRRGQTVQFHLRDAHTSEEDLRHLLHQYSPLRDKAKGALLFSCLGRGQFLYGRPDHDSRLFHGNVGPVPLGGFFCNGEIGPVAGTTYLHGYTSCFGVFRPKA